MSKLNTVQSYKKISFKDLKSKEFESVEFLDCDFNDAELTDFRFVNCRFVNSDFSLVKLKRSKLIDVEFVKCKVNGTNFNSENSGDWNFAISFEECFLQYSTFSDLSFKKSKIYSCEVLDCLFQEIDLSFCNCQYSDFSRTIFDKVDFSGADFRNAKNYFINISNFPKLKGCKFSRLEATNLLSGLQIEIE